MPCEPVSMRLAGHLFFLQHNLCHFFKQIDVFFKQN
jgi:hypothetical protein